MTNLTPSFEEVKKEIDCHDAAEALLEPRGTSFVCPWCGSGDGPNHTPALAVYDDHFCCYAEEPDPGKGAKTYDIFDLMGAVKGARTKLDQWDAACTWAGIYHERPRKAAVPTERAPMGAAKPARKKAAAPAAKPASPEEVEEYERTSAQTMEAARANMAADFEDSNREAAYAYLLDRGLDSEDVERLGIGYYAASERGCDGQVLRIAIPVPGSEWAHIDRLVRGAEGASKYRKPYLPQSVKDAGVDFPIGMGERGAEAPFIWLVEGAFDGCDLELAGRTPCILYGVGSADVAAEEIAAMGYEGIVILACDDDDEGRRATATAKDALEDAGIDCLRLNEEEGCYPGGAHDLAEVFERGGPDLFADFLAEEERQAIDGAEERERERDPLHRAGVESTFDHLAHFDACDLVGEPISTGFDFIDRALDGGLREGLVTTGAASSMGKTSLWVQIAENIAASGQPVLFVSVEQSVSELIAKGVCRRIHAAGVKSVRVSDFLSGQRRAEWSLEAQAAYKDAIADWRDRVAPWLYFYAPDGQPSMDDVAKAARALSDRLTDEDATGRRWAPVVVIDYLQLLGAADPHMSERQAVDYNVTRARQLARELHTPVCLISSLNRGANFGAVTFESFKESGGIEYSSDVLLALQPQGIGSPDQATSAEEEKRIKGHAREVYAAVRAKAVRDLELCVLKNRNGELGWRGSDGQLHGAYLTFDAQACAFSQTDFDVQA